MASSTEHVPSILVHFVERTRAVDEEVLLVTAMADTVLLVRLQD